MSREGRPSQRVARLTLIRDWFTEKLSAPAKEGKPDEQTAKANVD